MTEKLDRDRSETLLCQAVAHPEDFDRWNDLLPVFRHGVLPIERLRGLLGHANRDAVLGGLFVVDELYLSTRPLLKSVIGLASHCDPRIRCSALYALRSCAREGVEHIFVHVLRGLRDPDSTCRIAAMMLTAGVSEEVLIAAKSEVESAEEDLRQGIELLLTEATTRGARVSAFCQAGEAMARRFGMIAAARDHELWETLPELAARSGDADIRDFAESYARYRHGLNAVLARRRGR